MNEFTQTILGRTSVILQVSLKDGDRPVRSLSIRITVSDILEKEAFILSKRGFGNTFYGAFFQKNTTIDFALSNGLQVLEIKWEGDKAWATNLNGMGYTLSLKGYTQVVKWLKFNSVKR
ncbi:MAG: hypothetical protein ACJAZV_001205 [Roseivirga sp.]